MIPRDEIVMLRDWLYESDRITMGGIADINKLLKKYEVSPVVRCKDCVNYKDYTYDGEVSKWCTGWVDYLPTQPDDFCSQGERRDDD